MVELLQPLFIESNQFLIDSAGAGEWIGGHGCETVVMPYHGLLYMKFEYEGTLNPPFGLFGGLPGNGGCKYKQTPDGKRYFYQAHPDPDAFSEGERYVCISSGGGGYGSALERPAELVRELCARRAGLFRDGARAFWGGDRPGHLGYRRGGDRGTARAHAGNAGSTP